MSKHKRLHSMNGKGKYSKFAGFVGSRYSVETRHPKKRQTATEQGTHERQK